MYRSDMERQCSNECFGFELSVILSLIKLHSEVMQTHVYLPPLSSFSTGYNRRVVRYELSEHHAVKNVIKAGGFTLN